MCCSPGVPVEPAGELLDQPGGDRCAKACCEAAVVPVGRAALVLKRLTREDHERGERMQQAPGFGLGDRVLV